MKAYKGFNKNMICRDFQYEEGGEYQTANAKLCKEGFHACERPLDVFAYYPAYSSVYHEVELDGISDKTSKGDSKVCGRIIKIGKELSVADMVQKTIEWHIEKGEFVEGNHVTGRYNAVSATGDRGAASATGDRGAASATGHCGAASATGDRGAASATGHCGVASATGHCGVASATGHCGAASATGDCGAASVTGHFGVASATGYCGVASATGARGAASATGHCGAASATGDFGVASATGNCGAASADNPTAIAITWGVESRAKGVMGAHIVCAEWRWDKEYEEYKFIAAKMGVIDGEILKPDTYYALKNGEFVEA